MRLAFVTSEYVTEAYFAGGLASFLGRLCPALAERGHQVSVFVRAPADEPPFRCDGVDVHRVAPSRRLRRALRSILGRRWRSVAHGIAFAEAARREVGRASRRHGFECVQCANFGFVGLRVATAPGRARVVTRLSSDGASLNSFKGRDPSRPERVACHLEDLQIRRSRRVYAPSRYLAGAVGRRVGREIEVLPSPFRTPALVEDRGPLEALGGAPYALYFSRLRVHKGVGVLGHALPRMLAECQGLNFVVVGNDLNDEFEPSARAFLAERAGGGGARLRFFDDLRHGQLFPLIRGASMVLLPSRVENLSNACLEAMALGRPIVCSRGVSFEEMVTDGVSGAFFDNGDPDDLARVVGRLWRGEVREAMGREAARAIGRFSMDALLPRYEAYFSDGRSGREAP